MSASSCKITLPCFEHSTQTVSLAPSIIARMGSVVDFASADFTSHSKRSPFTVFIILLCLYLSKQQQPLTGGQRMDNARGQS